MLAGGAYPQAAVAAVPHRDDRADQERLAGGADLGPVLGRLHAEQRRSASTSPRSRLQRIPARGRAQGLPPLPRGLRPQRCGHAPGRPRAVHQRPDRAHPRRRPAGRAGRCSSRCLPRAEGDGGARGYDPHLVPGILGGSAGTTYDAFKLLEEARRHGARAALFGGRSTTASIQLTFVQVPAS